MRTTLLLICGFTLLSGLSSAGITGEDCQYTVMPVFVFGESAAWVGSGFAVGDGSCAVTTADLVMESFTSAAKVTVKFPTVVSPYTGDYYRAEVISTDVDRNLAVLHIPEKGLPAAPLAKKEAFKKVPLIAEKLLLSTEDHSVRWPTRIYGLMKSEKKPLDMQNLEWTAQKALASELRGVKWLYLAGVSPEEIPPKGSPVIRVGEGVVSMYGSKVEVSLIGGGKETKLELGQCLPSFEIVPLLVKAGMSESQLYEGARAASERDKAAAEAFQYVYRTLSFIKNGDWKMAAENAKSLVELRPNSAKAHRLLGVALAGGGANEKALKSLDKAAEMDPKLPGLQFDRAETLYALQKDKEAEAAYRKAMEESPTDIRPVLRLAKLLSLDESRRGEAIALARKAVALEPNSPGARMSLGLRLKETGDYDAAARELKRALSMAPAWAGARAALAETYRAAGKMAEAEEQYRILVEDNPRSPGALLALASFLTEADKKDDARKVLADLLKLNPPKELEESIKKLQAALDTK